MKRYLSSKLRLHQLDCFAYARNDRRIFCVLLAIILLSPPLYAKDVSSWKDITSGFSYKQIRSGSGKILAFKVDLKKFKVDTVLPKGKTAATAKELAKANDAMFVINANFFDPTFKPLGLIVKDHKVVNPVRKISWWSVFAIAKGSPSITHTSKFSLSNDISTAVQTGPRLLSGGVVPKGLKEDISERSAVCTTSDKKVIFIATDGAPQGFSGLAKILIKEKLGCVDALGLDGGGSTQFYLKFKGFELEKLGLTPVPVALGVFPATSDQ